jgi:hypothetical protein
VSITYHLYLYAVRYSLAGLDPAVLFAQVAPPGTGKVPFSATGEAGL